MTKTRHKLKIWQDEIMDKIITWDLDPTMLASKTFDNIVNLIQNSCLNFQIQLSPFAATISLKKSLIKDRTGSYVFPTASSFLSSNI